MRRNIFSFNHLNYHIHMRWRFLRFNSISIQKSNYYYLLLLLLLLL